MYAHSSTYTMGRPNTKCHNNISRASGGDTIGLGCGDLGAAACGSLERMSLFQMGATVDSRMGGAGVARQTGSDKERESKPLGA